MLAIDPVAFCGIDGCYSLAWFAAQLVSSKNPSVDFSVDFIDDSAGGKICRICGSSLYYPAD